MSDADTITPSTPFSELSAALATLPPRFHLADAVPTGAHSWRELTIPDVLDAELAAFADTREIDDPRIAASLYVQTMSMVLCGATIAAVVLHGRLPLVSVDDLYVAQRPPMFASGARHAAVVGLERDPRAPELPETAADLDELLARWSAWWYQGILAGLVDAVREVRRVGERVLRDNVASAALGAFVFLDWWSPELQVRARAEHLLGLGNPPIGEAVHIADVEHDGRTGLGSERRSCCMMLNLGDGRFCPGCPKVTAEQRRANMLTHLGHLADVKAGRRPPGPPRPGAHH